MKTEWVKSKKIEIRLKYPGLGVMPTPNLNYTIILDTIIITIQGSTQPIHLNTKIS
jgi:hypothetical protein